MIYVELRFPILTASLAPSCNRRLFCEISKFIPEARRAEWLQFDMRKIEYPHGWFRIGSQAELRMRFPESRLSLMLKLAGRRLSAGRSAMRIGSPEIALVKPASNLYARCVAIRGCFERDRFTCQVARRLDQICIAGEIDVGPRRALRVGCYNVAGYALKIYDLSEQGSLTLQEQGLGNFRHIGCGYFEPMPFDL